MRHALIVVLALGCADAALAESMGSAQEQAACRPDVRKFCSQVKAGDEQKYQACLQEHFSALSQKCQQVLMNHRT